MKEVLYVIQSKLRTFLARISRKNIQKKNKKNPYTDYHCSIKILGGFYYILHRKFANSPIYKIVKSYHPIQCPYHI